MRGSPDPAIETRGPPERSRYAGMFEIGICPITDSHAKLRQPALPCVLDPLLDLRTGRLGGPLQFIPFLRQFGEVRPGLLLMSEIEAMAPWIRCQESVEKFCRDSLWSRTIRIPSS
jgi:hypothetical protein